MSSFLGFSYRLFSRFVMEICYLCCPILRYVIISVSACQIVRWAHEGVDEHKRPDNHEMLVSRNFLNYDVCGNCLVAEHTFCAILCKDICFQPSTPISGLRPRSLAESQCVSIRCTVVRDYRLIRIVLQVEKCADAVKELNRRS